MAEQFKQGEVVWAKIKGHPWWPSVVSKPMLSSFIKDGELVLRNRWANIFTGIIWRSAWSRWTSLGKTHSRLLCCRSFSIFDGEFKGRVAQSCLWRKSPSTTWDIRSLPRRKRTKSFWSPWKQPTKSFEAKPPLRVSSESRDILKIGNSCFGLAVEMKKLMESFQGKEENQKDETQEMSESEESTTSLVEEVW